MPCKLQGCSMDEKVKSMLESSSVTRILKCFCAGGRPRGVCAEASLSVGAPGSAGRGAAVAAACAAPSSGERGKSRSRSVACAGFPLEIKSVF